MRRCGWDVCVFVKMKYLYMGVSVCSQTFTTEVHSPVSVWLILQILHTYWINERVLQNLMSVLCKEFIRIYFEAWQMYIQVTNIVYIPYNRAAFYLIYKLVDASYYLFFFFCIFFLSPFQSISYVVKSWSVKPMLFKNIFVSLHICKIRWNIKINMLMLNKLSVT